MNKIHNDPNPLLSTARQDDVEQSHYTKAPEIKILKGDDSGEKNLLKKMTSKENSWWCEVAEGKPYSIPEECVINNVVCLTHLSLNFNFTTKKTK